MEQRPRQRPCLTPLLQFTLMLHQSRQMHLQHPRLIFLTNDPLTTLPTRSPVILMEERLQEVVI